MGCANSSSKDETPGLAPPKKKTSPNNAAPKSNSNQGISKEKSASSHSAPAGGGKLLDKYALGKVLGQGAFGVVYKCKKKGTDEEYAVKMIDQVETPLIEIRREAEMLGKLEHPTAIKLHDVFYEKVFVCMVLDYYRGGDMIQGMMAHWKTKGMIPIANVKSLSKQMHNGCAWIHSQSCVHRDVKGDNFMMEKPLVEAPAQRLYLSDFGTVLELKQSERLTQKCGTKNYWPPEFYALNYGMKVDCWAVGVVMFGLVSGKFPFKGEDDVKNKKLVIPKRCPDDGQELIHKLLERNEETRLSCDKAALHPFLKDSAGGPSIPEVGGLDSEIIPEIKADGANAGVAQRRAELVDRLQKAGPQAEGGAKRQAEKADTKTFSVTDPATDRTMTFIWQSGSQQEVKAMLTPFEKAKTVSKDQMLNLEVTEESVRVQLTDHNVKVDGWGKGQAKKFSDFVAELQNGSCRLLLDATKHKCMVRAVNMVVMRISYGAGANKRILTVTKSLPGSTQYPAESPMQTAERLRSEILNVQEKAIAWERATEVFEVMEESPQYPGITTVYRKEIMVGELTSSKQNILMQLGLQGPAGNAPYSFEFTGGGVKRNFEWLTEDQCNKNNIQLKAKKDQDFSALVYPPIGLEEEELNEFLKLSSIDTSKWGTGPYKTLADFSEELVKGESTLMKQQNGKVARVVDIVVLQITRPNGDVLVEEKETYKGNEIALNRLPAVKRRADEHQHYTARRMISKHFGLDENVVEVNTEVKIVEEEQASKSWAGLNSVYRKRFMKGVIVG